MQARFKGLARLADALHCTAAVEAQCTRGWVLSVSSVLGGTLSNMYCIGECVVSVV